MVYTLERHGVNQSRPGRNLKPTPRQTYFQLLAERFNQRLLSPFVCSGCGLVGLDPVGRRGKGEWLCSDCSDPEGGRLQLDSWDDKQTGQKRSRLRVVGENLQLLGAGSSGSRQSKPGSQPRSANEQPPRTNPRTPAGQSKPPHDPDLDSEPDDIPF